MTEKKSNAGLNSRRWRSRQIERAGALFDAGEGDVDARPQQVSYIGSGGLLAGGSAFAAQVERLERRQPDGDR